jgi:hypothetical protein
MNATQIVYGNFWLRLKYYKIDLVILLNVSKDVQQKKVHMRD